MKTKDSVKKLPKKRVTRVTRVTKNKKPLSDKAYKAKEKAKTGKTKRVTSRYRVTKSNKKKIKEQQLEEAGLLETPKPKEHHYQLIEKAVDEKMPGVYYFGTDKEGNSLTPQWLCSPLFVEAFTRDTYQHNWGYLLRWYDRDNTVHTWAMPAELLGGYGEEHIKYLLERGLRISPSRTARQHITHYIMTAVIHEKALCTDKIGWHQGAFVLPSCTLGNPKEKIVFQSPVYFPNMYQQKGTLLEWKEHVASLCEGNSRLLFVVSSAFAALLLEHTGDENGGFHLVGASSEGKSTALYVAASVFGNRDYVHRWNTTINGLEAIAAIHSSTLLILDELGQVDPYQAGDIAYMLANGSGKQRANRIGTAKPRQQWQLLFLSSGETDLAQHIHDSGKRSKAGQMIRLLSFDANAGKEHGIFDTLHTFANGNDFSTALNQYTKQYYGTPLIAFIEAILAHSDTLLPTINEWRSCFLNNHLPKDACSQVQRAANRFALVAAAGELATEWGMTGWKETSAFNAAATCFHAWLNYRGGTVHQETLTLLDKIRAFFDAHSESRFSQEEDDHTKIAHHAGVREKNNVGQWVYYVFASVFNQEICAGYHPRHVANTLFELGIIEHKTAQTKHFWHLGKRRVYVFGKGLSESCE